AGAAKRDGTGRPARFMTKFVSGAYSNCASSYQLHKEAIPFPVFAPCAHACDGSLLWRAAAPQSADASSSNLRQPV
ncbi:MAG: hypothetical protein RR574_04145, partial [Comamonas sp.]